MNRLYFGNNLAVLPQHVGDSTVDLVYLDPPFNSKAQYNVLYETPANQRETAQRSVFNDSWHWEAEANACFVDVLAHGGATASILNSLKTALGTSDTMAYLAQMTARLIEFKRVMKPTASLYLHCDPTASHYLKIIMDAVFGPKNFKSEICWKRTNAHGRAKRWGPIHDTILFYTASDQFTWNRVYEQYDESYLKSHYRYTDAHGRHRLVTLDGPGVRKGSSGQPWRDVKPSDKGRHWELPPDRALPDWFTHPPGYRDMSVQDRLDVLEDAGLIHWPERGSLPSYKRYLAVSGGNPIQDVITDIPAVNSQAQERMGFPTQKPVSLLKRIIEASSNPGDVVLDPFCGCGTTVQAAAELKRDWIGIDVSYYGVKLIERRVRSNFGPKYPLRVDGIPADLVSAEALAETAPYGFQQWIVDELGCQVWNNGKKGADGGIDGEMWFFAGPGAPGRLLVQVKGGKTGVGAVREFRRVIDREKAQMGVFVSRHPPTAEMRHEAAEAGRLKIGSAAYERITLVWLETWFAGQQPRLPTPIPLRASQDRTARGKAPKRPDAKQTEMAFVFDGGLIGPTDGQILNPSVLPEEALKTG